MPTIVVLNDFDNYFQRLVEEWCKRKLASKLSFKHHTIQIDSGPYRMDAVTTESKAGVLTLDFYSALRTGFGRLPKSDILKIIDLL